ncbi:MAG TPA: transketolase C-terminal domain-containing protein [Steroidobacteraceae bacterium]|jgi:transketolase|nr:transketolase C-terminal domain-containing protein [Steroidobacteraceae bacterium]
MREAPYETVLKPYGEALTALARTRREIVCVGADLTRQTETDLFRDAIPERFFNAGMAEANMIGIAAGLARAGHVVFVNTFGVFCTRRCFDQIAMALAYPRLNVRLVGFMPGLSSPGGPSHQAIEDVALMRALPNMMVLEPADAIEIRQAVTALADHAGPVYMRLKRGESPLIFDESHRLQLDRAQHLTGHGSSDVCLVAAGMMLPAALAAARTLEREGLAVAVINSPVIKPLDGDTILAAARGTRVIITAENHSIIGGLGSAVAEVLAAAGVGAPLRRVGIADVFAESGSREYLFSRYGLDTLAIVRTAWEALARAGPVPRVISAPAAPGSYAPV